MQFLAQDPYVLCGRLMIGIECNKDLTISRADRRTIAKGEINSACRQPDVIKHVLDFVRRNDLANDTAHLKKAFLG
jgi:hypothetical protein